MANILLNYEQRQRVKALGFNKPVDDFFELFNLLPSTIVVNDVSYYFNLNRNQFGSTICYANKYCKQVIIYVERNDWNEACIKMLELLKKHNYKKDYGTNP